MKRLLVAVAVVVGLAGGTARADVLASVLTSGYVLTLGVSGIATAVNGSSIAYDQPSSRGWRILGMAAGSVDIAIGASLFVAVNDRSEGIILGSIAVALGAAALSTGYFAKEDVQVGIIQVSGGAIFSLGRRF